MKVNFQRDEGNVSCPPYYYGHVRGTLNLGQEAYKMGTELRTIAR